VQFVYRPQAPDAEKLGCLVLFLAEAALKPPAGLKGPLRTALTRALALKEFEGKPGQTQVVLTGAPAVPRLLLVGLGPAKALEREKLRRAAGSAAHALRGMNLAEAGVWLPPVADAALAKGLGEVVAEGVTLGAYTFESYKAKKPTGKDAKAELARVTLFDPARATSNAAVTRGATRGDAVCLARNLGNEPANAMTPADLAAAARAIAKRRGLKVRVLERAQLERLGFGMLLGVARGSRTPPKLIVLEHRPPRAKGTLAFVGKGITFDSGGISLKPGQAMDEMKFDMCGAAAVLGAMDAIGAAKPAVNVVGVVPACENLPGGEALKPGDILKSFKGTHVEILNTDAEGRLILGDALAYAVKTFKPDAVVDLATLTGACVIALGHYATGAVTNHEGWQAQVVAAGRAAGDVVWPLPNFPEFEELLKGKYAELQNIGPREGGAITAGLFLKHFVDPVPWVHLDIAGTAWGVKKVGHQPNEGATGVGVCLLADLAANWSKPKPA